MAVFALLLDLTGSATAVAWMMIVQFLPVAIVGPMAGVVVDRVDRRRLMIGADVVRGVLILGLLLVRRPQDVWLAYVVMTLSVSASAFFEPARTATIPNITSPTELMPANALSAATWSAMLALGASVGGLVTWIAGRNVAFTVNAISFFVSAAFLMKMRVPAGAAPPPRAAGLLALTGIPDLVDGLRYVRSHSHVAALMFVKAGWGLAGGVLLLLTIFGQQVFPVGGSTAAGIGVLYGARGIGAALGPIALRWLVGHEARALRSTIGPSYFMIGLFYVALAWAPNLPLAAACVLLRALRRVGAVGVQHGAAADGGARSVSRAGVLGRARVGDALLVDLELLDRPPAGHAAGRRARWPSPWARCSASLARSG